MDPQAALRPLDEAADALHRLEHYERPEELSDALGQVAAAVERSLRLALRTDSGAPDDHRLNALSPETPLDRVVENLRSRDLISIETAGSVHDLGRAVERAEADGVRAGDADTARTAARRLRADLSERTAGAAPEPSAAGHGSADGAPTQTPPPSEGEGSPPLPGAGGRGRIGRWMAWLAAAVVGLALVAVAWVTLRGGAEEYETALAMFRAGRYEAAAVALEEIREDRPTDPTVALYLARSYRRMGRPAEAGDVLRSAVANAPDDDAVRRELGHLFRDLDRSRAAVEQYERALELNPEEPLNWASLIRALRDQGDERATRLLRDAPPEVREALGEESEEATGGGGGGA